MKSKILENIRNIRKSQNRTQAEIAEEMGVSLTAYGNFERGKTRLTQERLEKIAKIFGKTPSSVVNGYETVEGEAATLEEFREREEQFKNLLDTANGKIQELEKELDAAKKIISSQQHSIELLQDIRKMLERQIKER